MRQVRVLNTGGPHVLSTGVRVANGEIVHVDEAMVPLLPRWFIVKAGPDSESTDTEPTDTEP